MSLLRDTSNLRASSVEITLSLPSRARIASAHPIWERSGSGAEKDNSAASSALPS